jgi:hypothetical protein
MDVTGKRLKCPEKQTITCEKISQLDEKILYFFSPYGGFRSTNSCLPARAGDRKPVSIFWTNKVEAQNQAFS